MGEIREQAAGVTLGMERWRRYVSAFDRVLHCIEHGYQLEAVAILDSLITDRLTSRLGYLQGCEPPARALGQLCRSLVGSKENSKDPGLERDDEFRTVIMEIRAWAEERNHAIHATAKIFRNDDPIVSFDDVITAHKHTAVRGVSLLQRFDLLDTAARRKARRIPASAPYAFFPEKRPGRA
ncbi:hypothetical protein GV791_17625 [Nocardia cyriacigeorgica]|uniref:DUF4145 domain-containing protein n=1 Tax=Nocardia cyriacigeorgica TaxID=135487 RepID=A0A6P1CSI6_9NOCA|nr:hypothetical protein [Nocardia cyriacigeorgica]NEW34364.1 hypothetical protein [Nocardia cyriacigeorgica]